MSDIPPELISDIYVDKIHRSTVAQESNVNRSDGTSNASYFNRDVHSTDKVMMTVD